MMSEHGLERHLYEVPILIGVMLLFPCHRFVGTRKLVIDWVLISHGIAMGRQESRLAFSVNLREFLLHVENFGLWFH